MHIVCAFLACVIGVVDGRRLEARPMHGARQLQDGAQVTGLQVLDASALSQQRGNLGGYDRSLEALLPQKPSSGFGLPSHGRGGVSLGNRAFHTSMVPRRYGRNLDRSQVLLQSQGGFFQGLKDMFSSPEENVESLVGKEIDGAVIAIESGSSLLGRGAVLSLRGGLQAFLPEEQASLAGNKDITKIFRVGQLTRVVVTSAGEMDISLRVSRVPLIESDAWSKLELIMAQDEVINAEIVGFNSGGANVLLDVRGDDMKAFCPKSEMPAGIEHRKLTKALIGEKWPVKVISVAGDDYQGRPRPYVSSKQAIADSANLQVGQLVEAVVENVLPYGVNVAIEANGVQGISGWLHISEISQKWIERPSSVFQMGERIKAVVVQIDENKRVVLSTKVLEPARGAIINDRKNMFENAERDYVNFFNDRVEQGGIAPASSGADFLSAQKIQAIAGPAVLAGYRPGQLVEGKVAEIVDYGVFVDMEGGIRGLLHVTEFSDNYIRSSDLRELVGSLPEIKAVVISLTRRTKAPVLLSTKILEPYPGAMVTDPKKVFETAHLNYERLYQERIAGEKVESNITIEKAFNKFRTGQLVEAVVTRIENLGVWVTTDSGVPGLIFRGEMSNRPVEDIATLFKFRDRVKAVVISTNNDVKRLILSTKVLEPSPGDILVDRDKVFDRAEENYEELYANRLKGEKQKELRRRQSKQAFENFEKIRPGQLVEVDITKIAHEGIFVRTDGGIAGMVHLREISKAYVPFGRTKIGQFFEDGGRLKAVVLGVDEEKNSLSLSTKVLESEPGLVLEDPGAVFRDAEKNYAKFYKQRLEEDGGTIETILERRKQPYWRNKKKMEERRKEGKALKEPAVSESVIEQENQDDEKSVSESAEKASEETSTSPTSSLWWLTKKSDANSKRKSVPTESVIPNDQQTEDAELDADVDDSEQAMLQQQVDDFSDQVEDLEEGLEVERGRRMDAEKQVEDLIKMVADREQELRDLGEEYRRLSDELEFEQDASSRTQAKLWRQEFDLKSATSKLEKLGKKIEQLQKGTVPIQNLLDQPETAGKPKKKETIAGKFFESKQERKLETGLKLEEKFEETEQEEILETRQETGSKKVSEEKLGTKQKLEEKFVEPEEQEKTLEAKQETREERRSSKTRSKRSKRQKLEKTFEKPETKDMDADGLNDEKQLESESIYESERSSQEGGSEGPTLDTIRPPPREMQLQVVVPDGLVEGQEFTIQSPSGKVFSIQVPAGVSGGGEVIVSVPDELEDEEIEVESAAEESDVEGWEERVIGSPPEEVELKVIVPDGAAAGEEFTFESPKGNQFTIQVPEGLQTGDEFVVKIME